MLTFSRFPSCCNTLKADALANLQAVDVASLADIEARMADGPAVSECGDGVCAWLLATWFTLSPFATLALCPPWPKETGDGMVDGMPHEVVSFPETCSSCMVRRRPKRGEGCCALRVLPSV